MIVLEDDVILGTIKINLYPGATNLMLRICPKLNKLFNTKEIVFDYNKLIMRIPTIDDNKTYKINGNQIGFSPKNMFNEDFTGIYNVIEEDEIFYLIKQ